MPLTGSDVEGVVFSGLVVVPVFSELPELSGLVEMGVNFGGPQMSPTASSQTPDRPLMPTATSESGQYCVASSHMIKGSKRFLRDLGPSKAAFGFKLSF
jgi:hypothetical protein